MKKIFILFWIMAAFASDIFAIELAFLKEAIINGDESQAKQILQEFPKILLTDTNPPTALHLAAEEGNLAIVKNIIASLKNFLAHEASSYLSTTSNDKYSYTAYQCANAKAQEIEELKKQIGSFDKELTTLEQQKQELLSSIKNISQEEALLKKAGNQKAFFSKQEEKNLQENKVIELIAKIAKCEEEKSKALPGLKAKPINYSLIANSIRKAKSEFSTQNYR